MQRNTTMFSSFKVLPLFVPLRCVAFFCISFPQCHFTKHKNFVQFRWMFKFSLSYNRLSFPFYFLILQYLSALVRKTRAEINIHSIEDIRQKRINVFHRTFYYFHLKIHLKIIILNELPIRRISKFLFILSKTSNWRKKFNWSFKFYILAFEL